MFNADAAYLTKGDRIVYNGETWRVAHVRILPSYVVSLKIQRGNEIIYGVSADMIERVVDVSNTRLE